MKRKIKLILSVISITTAGAVTASVAIPLTQQSQQLISSPNSFDSSATQTVTTQKKEWRIYLSFGMHGFWMKGGLDGPFGGGFWNSVPGDEDSDKNKLSNNDSNDSLSVDSRNSL